MFPSSPNRTHVPVCRKFLEAGFHVVCDKPLGVNLEEARTLREVVRQTGRVFALTHNYTGYPLVKQAREMVRNGELGEVRKVVAEYAQGGLRKPIERDGQKQASWRTDPEQAGAAGCLGDIGTHAESLARYITGLEIDELCADFTAFVAGRRLEDDASLLLHYKGGARGILHASQICADIENALAIKVYGSKASLEWEQERPNELIVNYSEAPQPIYRPGNSCLQEAARRFERLPAGHPEGFIEAFASIYWGIARAIRAVSDGRPVPPDCDFPTIEDGLGGMAFLATALESAEAGGVWRSMHK